MKLKLISWLMVLCFLPVETGLAAAEGATSMPYSQGSDSAVSKDRSAPDALKNASAEAYQVGVGDVLEISILQPDQFVTTVTVAPDGSISFPYIGNIKIKGLSLSKIQSEIQSRLAAGYIKYPVVTVYLKESKSRKFSVYGEVMKPGDYALDESVTVLRAVSLAGGFTKFGSPSRIKVLRRKNTGRGYETLKINLKRVMDGDEDDVPLEPGDMVVVSEGIF